MKVVGVTADGAAVFSTPLTHGQDPEVLAFDEGFAIERPLDAARGHDLDIVLRVQVRPLQGQARPRPRLRGLDKGLVLDEIDPVVRQRVAAYAVVVSDRGLLATEYSDRTAVAERWGMPGGGIADDEEPAGAVLREVAEETSQMIGLGELIRIQTSHWIGRSPRDQIEDFHAIRLIYRGTCTAPTEPVVVDRGGTTESARWVPLAQWRELPWTINWQEILGELLGTED